MEYSNLDSTVLRKAIIEYGDIGETEVDGNDDSDRKDSMVDANDRNDRKIYGKYEKLVKYNRLSSKSLCSSNNEKMNKTNKMSKLYNCEVFWNSGVSNTNIEKEKPSETKVQSYTVVWHQVLLGLEFKPNFLGYPTIVQIHQDSCLSQTKNGALGDYIVAVNGVPFCGNFQKTMDIIMSPKRPITLEFNRIKNVAPSLTLKGTLSRYYGVVWREGQMLGAALKFRKLVKKDEKMVAIGVTVYQVHETSSADGMRQATPGDILVQVNSKDVRNMEFEHVISLLQKEVKPVLVIFKRDINPKELDSQTYDIQFEGGKLGIVFICHDNPKIGCPIIAKVSEICCEGLQNADIGDELVYIGQLSTQNLGYQQSIAILKTIRCSTRLQFKKRQISKSIHFGDCLLTLLSGLTI